MIVTKFLLFGILGLFAELAFTSIKSLILKKDWSLRGETSLWMFFIYGLISFIYPVVYFKVSHFGVVMRGLSYMIAFFIAQLVIGWLLGKFKACPWGYSGKLAVAGGLIDFAYAPVWFVAGLAIEKVYPFVSRVAGLI